ncbi:Nicotianamine synthase protein-domain-containing protein [Spinellus fusiger]|nr:Nicotianamine synthase protein-domain-containing protein [Spinellus fusiger]
MTFVSLFTLYLLDLEQHLSTHIFNSSLLVYLFMTYTLISDKMDHCNWSQCSSSITIKRKPTMETDPRSIQEALVLVERVNSIYQQLSDASSFCPSENINALFKKLVQICIITYETWLVDFVLECPSLQTIMEPLRALCSVAEYHLEVFWCRKLVHMQGNLNNKRQILSHFVYYDNYYQLACLELNTLQGLEANMDRIVFVGCGPLPLSSILMALQCRKIQKIDNIDKDVDAIVAARQLTQKLEMENQLEYHEMDATAYDYRHADIVVLAALVGENPQEKMSFLKCIASSMKPGALVLVRSAHSLRKILYSSISPYQVNQCGFQTLANVDPYNDVVNSIIVARRY